MSMVKSALRSLRQAPGTTTVVVATLAVGIALVTGIFTLINGYAWAELPYDQADRVVAVGVQAPRRANLDMLSRNVVRRVHELDDAFQSTAAYVTRDQTIRAGNITISSGVLAAEPTLLPLLRMMPVRGRSFDAQDRNAAVLTEAMSRKLFPDVANVIGKSIFIDGAPYSVTGILAKDRGFENAGVIVPLEQAPTEWAWVLARLKDGATAEGAKARLNAVAIADGDEYDKGSVLSLNPDMVQRASAMKAGIVLLLFIVATSFVLLIACVNVVAVLLARGVTRRASYAIRATLGASSRRLLAENLCESLIIACTACVLGVMLASWGIHLMIAALGAPLLSWLTFPIDMHVVVFAGMTALAAMLAVGWIPARQASRAGPISLLNATTSTTGVRQARLVKTLVTAEVALSVALFIGALLLVRSYRKSLQIDVGYDDTNIAIAAVHLDPTRFHDVSTIDDYIARSQTALSSLPAAARGFSGQFLTLRTMAADSIPRYGFPVDVTGPVATVKPDQFNVVDAGFFETLKLPMVSGRLFDAGDANGQLGVVISESLAKSLYGRQNAVGQAIKMQIRDGVYATVVGVVGDRMRSRSNRHGFATVRTKEVYFSSAQAIARDLTFTARGTTAALPQKLSRALQQANPDVAVAKAESLFERNRPIFEIKVMGSIFGIIATVALLLAMIGLFGIIAYAARQRTREIGIRMALGALPSRIARDVLDHAFRIVGGGLALGFVLAFAISRIMQTLFYGVRQLDLVAYVAVGVLFAMVGIAAAWMPTRRAMRIDPMEALRPE